MTTGAIRMARQRSAKPVIEPPAVYFSSRKSLAPPSAGLLSGNEIMIATGMPRATRHTIEAGGTFESNGIAINYTSASRFPITRQSHARGFDPGCDESFDIERVEISLREGVWIELTPGEYSDDGVIDTIIDWRYREEMDAQMYRTELAA